MSWTGPRTLRTHEQLSGKQDPGPTWRRGTAPRKPNVRITNQQVKEARFLRTKGCTFDQIARQLRISMGSVYRYTADVHCPELRGRTNKNRRLYVERNDE